MLRLIPFATWAAVLEHVGAGKATWYQAPLDTRAVRVRVGLRRRGTRVRVTPPGGDCDPFTADAGHLDRFRREDPRTLSFAVDGASEVFWIDPDGSEHKARAVDCAKCGKRAVVALSPALLARQPDDTTHVCHPALDGCNHGFSCLPAGGAA